MADTRAQPEATPPAADKSLHSWKEIAVYLRRDVRTVQRWEKTEGLPVHRHWHRRLGSVYAYKAELEAWWNNHRVALETQEPVEAAEPVTVLPVEPPESRRISSRFWSMGVGLALAGFGVGLTVAWVFLIVPRWRVNPTPAQGSSSRLLATIKGDVAGGMMGMFVAAADVNGDGLADAVVGGVSAEAAIVFGGNLRSNLNLARDASVLLLEEHGHNLRLMGAADINGDGIKDLIWAKSLGADRAGFTATGPVLVVLGRRQWKDKLNLPRDADLEISISVPYNASPSETANTNASDWNGDGTDDLIFTANDYSPPDRASAGEVFVFWGRRKWPRELEATTQADVVIWGARKGEGLGRTAVGDINGDGKNDLIVAALDNSLWAMRQHQGRIYAFFGRGQAPRKLDAATDFDLRIDGAEAHDRFHRLTLGDVNGDGNQDIVVGAPAGDVIQKPGRVFVYYGRRKWQREMNLSQADWQLVDSDPRPGFGFGVIAQDLNRDGNDDLVVGKQTPGLCRILVFYGDRHRQGRTSSGLADLTWSDDTGEKNTCGTNLAVGDFDGGETPEVLIGDPSAIVGGKPEIGKALVLSLYRPIKIDIRPGSYPNPIWPGSEHVVAVAVPTQEGFDPDSLDPGSVRFAGAAASSNSLIMLDGVHVPHFFFDSKGLRIRPGDRTAALTGKTKDGTPVYGVDSVMVMTEPAGKPQEKPARKQPKN